MSGAVQSETIRCVAHSVNRFTIEIATTPHEFRARYERALSMLGRQVRHHDAEDLGAEAFDQLRMLREERAHLVDHCRIRRVRLLGQLRDSLRRHLLCLNGRRRRPGGGQELAENARPL